MAEAHAEILVQPVNANVQQGSNALFQLVAHSASPLTYQWFYGDGSFDGSDQSIEGATNATLVLSNADSWAGQVFRVAISDGTGYLLSLPASLQVSPAATAGGGRFAHWHLDSSVPVSSIAGVAYGNGHYVAAGTDVSGVTSILESDDGIQWNKQSPGPLNPQWMSSAPQLNGVALGNGTFVIVGDAGTVLTSTDAVAWSSHALTPVAAPTLQGVTFDQGLFVAVSNDDNGSLWSSSDGVTWTNSGFEFERSFQSVAAGAGYFVAVGDTILGSENGVDWNPAQFPDNLLGDYGNFDSVCFGNGVFLATKQQTRSNPGVGACGSPGLFLSLDHTNWIDVTPTNGLQFMRVTFGNGQFVAVDSSSAGITFSTDGINWSPPLPVGDAAHSVCGTPSIGFAQGLFIAAGQDCFGIAALFTSQNASSWTYRNQGRTIPSQPDALINANGEYVGCANDGFITSSNGSDWSFRTSTNSVYYEAIAFRNGVLVAVGQFGNFDAITTSTNGGVDWAEQTLSFSSVPSLTSLSLGGVTAANGGFVAVGELRLSVGSGNYTNYSQLISSTNGIDWKLAPVNSQFGNGLVTIAYGNGTYVAIGNQAVPNGGVLWFILSSTNGTTWQKTFSSAQGSTSESVAFGDGHFAVVGSDQAGALVLTSADGQVWSRHAGPSGTPLYVVFGDGLFLGTDGSGKVYSSIDGINWDAVSSNLSYVNTLWSGEGVFLAYCQDAFGNPGLFQSDPTEQLGQPNLLPDRRFQFSITGARNLAYDIEASDDLLNWQMVGDSNKFRARATVY